MAARPLASVTVVLRADCSTKCSVTSALTNACWRACSSMASSDG
jgi:hypothetical protein